MQGKSLEIPFAFFLTFSISSFPFLFFLFVNGPYFAATRNDMLLG